MGANPAQSFKREPRSPIDHTVVDLVMFVIGMNDTVQFERCI